MFNFFLLRREEVEELVLSKLQAGLEYGDYVDIKLFNN